MSKNSFYSHTLTQLREFLSSSTRKLEILMNQRGTAMLARHNRTEIKVLKDLIDQRKSS